MKTHIFNAGPALLPEIVKQQTIEAIKDFKGTGVSILEFGHRTKEVEHFFYEAEKLCLELLSLNANDYAVVFLQGGATTQFFQIPYNFLEANQTAAYVETGSFSTKAIQAAKDFGTIDVLASSKDKNFTYIPKTFEIADHYTYLHLTANNTICGTQWKNFPMTTVPLIADMTSDFMSRDIDYSKFSLIYAGAQKNVGIAGNTVVVIKKDFLEKCTTSIRKIPSMLSYKAHIANTSMVNTPNVLAVYVTLLTMQWIKGQGGLKAMENKSIARAQQLYDTLEDSIFRLTVTQEDRSLMNVCFVLDDKTMEEEFYELCTQHDIVGIKGHRSVGGFRASIYNAIEDESIDLLCDLIQYFSNKNG